MIPPPNSAILESGCVSLCLALAALVVAAANGQVNEQPSSGATNNSIPNPYWRRPGCYRVGHTRTISIPGCVKFNLSTNACRGYCMSYSIPASEDFGAGSSQIVHDSFQLLNSLQLNEGTKSVDREHTIVPETSGGQRQQHSSQPLIRGHQHAHGLFSQDQSGERRDVVSVSQCCNMMETEDVVVNLRCGANEIRRLVFKSAKTCECFFCKHV